MKALLRYSKFLNHKKKGYLVSIYFILKNLEPQMFLVPGSIIVFILT